MKIKLLAVGLFCFSVLLCSCATKQTQEVEKTKPTAKKAVSIPPEGKWVPFEVGEEK